MKSPDTCPGRRYKRVALENDQPDDHRKGEFSFANLDRLMRERPAVDPSKGGAQAKRSSEGKQPCPGSQ